MTTSRLPSPKLITLAFALLSTTAQAAETDWLTERQLWKFIKTEMGSGENAKLYATAIECGQSRGKTYFRMIYTALDGPKPFHKWMWVHGETDKLMDLASRIRLKSKPELKYRIIQQDTYTAQNGKQMGCAVVYR